MTELTTKHKAIRWNWISGWSILTLLLTLMIPALLVLCSIRLVMTNTYLQIEYNKPDFPPDSYGFTLADRLYFAPFALDYLLNDAGIDYLGKLTLPKGGSFYQPDELSHMADVKNVMRGAMNALVILVVVLGGVILFSARSWNVRQALRQGLFNGSMLTLFLLVSLLVYIILDWDNFFTRFHDLFFAEGSWQFAYSDSLIRLFPIRFWQDAAITVGGMCGVVAVVILVVTFRWGRRVNRLAR